MLKSKCRNIFKKHIFYVIGSDTMLTDDFILLCDGFSKDRTDILNKTVLNDKKFCRYNIEFFSYVLEFVYVKKESVYYKPSSIFCTIKLQKNSIVHYHLPDIIPYLKRKSFNACYFTAIENSERLSYCFDRLVEEIENVTSQLNDLQIDNAIISERLFENYKLIFSLKEKDIDFSKINVDNDFSRDFFQSLQKTRDGFVFSRFTNFTPYTLLKNNKINKSIAKYEKLNAKNLLFDYEKELLDYIKNPENTNITIFPSFCNSAPLEQKFLSFGILVKAFLIIFLISSAVFCGFFACYNFIVSKGTVLSLCAPWQCGFLCGGLCSVFGAITLFPHFSNKHLTKKQRRDFAKMTISKPLKIFSYTIFILSVIVSSFFAVMMAKENVRFYDDKIEFASACYSYDQVNSVYYIKSRYNPYGDKIKRPSYVILFDDKTSLDLDGCTSVEYTKKHVLRIFEEKNIKIKQADSEKQLPWYSEP